MLEIGVEVLGGLVWWGGGGRDFSQNDGQTRGHRKTTITLCNVVACKKEVILIYKTVLPLRI